MVMLLMIIGFYVVMWLVISLCSRLNDIVNPSSPPPQKEIKTTTSSSGNSIHPATPVSQLPRKQRIVNDKYGNILFHILSSNLHDDYTGMETQIIDNVRAVLPDASPYFTYCGPKAAFFRFCLIDTIELSPTNKDEFSILAYSCKMNPIYVEWIDETKFYLNRAKLLWTSLESNHSPSSLSKHFGPSAGKMDDLFECIEKGYFIPRQRKTEEFVRSMDWRTFEKWITEVLNNNGYEAYTTPPTNDGGKDIIATKDDETYYIECKHWSADAIIGRELLQKLVGSAAGSNVKHSIFIATCQYNDNAKEYAQSLNAAGMMTIELWGMEEILSLANNIDAQHNKISSSTSVPESPVEQNLFSEQDTNYGNNVQMTENQITEKTPYLCPKCKTGTLHCIAGINGTFWSCSNYPNCTATYDDNNGFPIFPSSKDSIPSSVQRAEPLSVMAERLYKK